MNVQQIKDLWTASLAVLAKPPEVKIIDDHWVACDGVFIERHKPLIRTDNPQDRIIYSVSMATAGHCVVSDSLDNVEVQNLATTIHPRDAILEAVGWNMKRIVQQQWVCETLATEGLFNAADEVTLQNIQEAITDAMLGEG